MEKIQISITIYRRGAQFYLVADFIPLSMQKLDPLLQDGQILGTDVAGQRLAQHSQMGQISSPAIKRVLQFL